MSPPMRMRKVEVAVCACKSPAGKNTEAAAAAPICDRNRRLLGAALGWKAGLIVLALSQMLPALVVLAVMLVRRRRVRGHLAVGAVMAILGALALTAAR